MIVKGFIPIKHSNESCWRAIYIEYGFAVPVLGVPEEGYPTKEAAEKKCAKWQEFVK